jgi:ABC-type sugar transport system permease subunit
MKIKRSTTHKIVGLLFVLPWIIGFLWFTLYPFVETIRYSFSDVRFLLDGVALDPVGFNNFVHVLAGDPDFLLRLPGFLMQMFLLVPMVLVFSIILALILNTPLRGRRIFRAIFFLPVIIMSGAVLDNLQRFGATRLSGLEHFFVYQFIGESLPNFLSTPILFIFDNVVMFLWFSGVQILIFLSGLQKVDRSIYEASSVDGASAWQKFWKITIPTIKPFIFLCALYTVVHISNSPLNPIITLIQDAMFSLIRGFGFAAATTWLYFFLVVAVVFFYYMVLGRTSEKEVQVKGRYAR